MYIHKTYLWSLLLYAAAHVCCLSELGEYGILIPGCEDVRLCCNLFSFVDNFPSEFPLIRDVSSFKLVSLCMHLDDSSVELRAEFDWKGLFVFTISRGSLFLGISFCTCWPFSSISPSKMFTYFGPTPYFCIVTLIRLHSRERSLGSLS